MKKIRIEDINPNLGIDILDELSKYCNIPKYGILGGQSVASIIFKMLRLNNVESPINDIDVFLPLLSSSKYLLEETFNKQFNAISTITSTKNIIYNHNGEYSGINTLKCEKIYKVINSTRIGMLNIVYINLLHKYKDLYSINDHSNNYFITKILINDFDINSVQCGIDLVSKKLFVSNNFLNFIKNRQLEIVNFKTPIHSLIRILGKEKELNVNYNKELDISIISKLNEINQKYYVKEKNKIKSNSHDTWDFFGDTETDALHKDKIINKLESNISFNFGDIYHKKFLNIENELVNYFDLNSNILNDYNYFGFDNKITTYSNLDNYIYQFIYGQSYNDLFEPASINNLDRINILQKNIPNIIKNSIEKNRKSYFFHNNTSYESIQHTLNTSKGFYRINKEILNVDSPKNDFIPIECYELLEDEYDKEKNNHLLYNLNEQDILYWTLILKVLKKIILSKHHLPFNFNLFIKDNVIELNNSSIIDIIDPIKSSFNLSPSEVDELLSIQKDDIVFNHHNLIDSFLAYSNDLKDMFNKNSSSLFLKEYFFIKEIDLLDSNTFNSYYNDLWSIALSCIDIISPYLLKILIRKNNYIIADKFDFFQNSFLMKTNDSLLQIMFEHIVSSNSEVVLAKNILLESNISCNEHKINRYLITNKHFSDIYKQNILYLTIDELNKSATHHPDLLLTFVSLINNLDYDSIYNYIFTNLKSKKMLLLFIENNVDFLSDKDLITLLTTFSKNELLPHIKNCNVSSLLNKINY